MGIHCQITVIYQSVFTWMNNLDSKEAIGEEECHLILIVIIHYHEVLFFYTLANQVYFLFPASQIQWAGALFWHHFIEGLFEIIKLLERRGTQISNEYRSNGCYWKHRADLKRDVW